MIMRAGYAKQMATWLHTCYRIGDIDRSVAFYNALGFEEIGRMPIGDEAMRSVAGRASKVSNDAENEVRDQLSKALARLPEADREIIELRHTGGMSFRALSDYYGEPVGTLLARHHRALRKLRVMLEDMGVGDSDAAAVEP
jgi:RNA polymerase sigma factor (sigma-70 family)